MPKNIGELESLDRDFHRLRSGVQLMKSYSMVSGLNLTSAEQFITGVMTIRMPTAKTAFCVRKLLFFTSTVAFGSIVNNINRYFLIQPISPLFSCPTTAQLGWQVFLLVFWLIGVRPAIISANV